MKKINKLALHNAKTLTFPEMKNISGGYDVIQIDGGTCGVDLGNGMGLCAMSKESVERVLAAGIGTGWWCCDSCSSTDYCGNGK